MLLIKWDLNGPGQQTDYVASSTSSTSFTTSATQLEFSFTLHYEIVCDFADSLRLSQSTTSTASTTSSTSTTTTSANGSAQCPSKMQALFAAPSQMFCPLSSPAHRRRRCASLISVWGVHFQGKASVCAAHRNSPYTCRSCKPFPFSSDLLRQLPSHHQQLGPKTRRSWHESGMSSADRFHINFGKFSVLQRLGRNSMRMVQDLRA